MAHNVSRGEEEPSLPRREVTAAALGQLAVMGRLFTGAARRLSVSAALRRSMILWSGSGLLLTLGAGASSGWLGGQLGLGLGVSAAWWAAVTACLFAGVSLLLSHPDQTPIEHFGLPNGITAIRAYLSLPVILYAALPPTPLSRELVLAIAAPIAALDSADGYIARRIGPLTVLGRAIDPIMDTVFFSLCAVACLVVGLVPIWLGVLIFARYGLPGVGFLILYPWLRRRPALVATNLGKASTVLGAVALAVSSLLVLAGGPAQPVDIALGCLLAGTTLGHFSILWRRTFPGAVAAKRA